MAKRVVIVDPFDDERDMYVVLLRAAGFDVRVAQPNVDAAVAVIVAAAADLVITRILPGTFGIRLIERLKRQPATRQVPLVVLTTYTSREIAEQARRAGASEVVLLPHDVRHILSLAQRLTRTTQ